MDTIKNKILEADFSVSNDTALKFIGTSGCDIVHPEFGRHALTKNQFKYSSGEYKNKLYSNIVQAISYDLSICGYDSGYFKMLNVNEQNQIREALKDIKDTFV